MSECTDCPETGEVLQPTQTYVFVYAGGPPHAQYLALRQLLPAGNIIPQYGIVSITDQGWIQYRDGQDTTSPAGWEEVEKGLYKPLWPECAVRVLRARLLDNGLLTLQCGCADPRTGRRSMNALTLPDCQQCQMRTRITY